MPEYKCTCNLDLFFGYPKLLGVVLLFTIFYQKYDITYITHRYTINVISLYSKVILIYIKSKKGANYR